MTAATCDVYHPFDAGTGADVLEDRWRDMATHWLRSGPIAGVLNGFQVYADSTGMQIKVKTGAAWVRGHYCQNNAERTHALATYSVARLDLVVIRAVFGSNLVETDVLAGPGGITLPTLTRNTAIWEVAIAVVLVDTGTTIAAAKVSDLRQFATGRGGITPCLSPALPSDLGVGAPGPGDALYETDTNRLRVWNGSAWRLLGGKLAGVALQRVTTLTLANGTWTMPTLSETYDSDGLHAGTDGFITIVEAGVYRIAGRVAFSANSTGARGVAVQIGGSAFSSGNPTDLLGLLPASSGNTNFVVGSGEFDLAAGDKVSFCAFSSGTGVGLDLTSAGMTATLIGYRT